MELIKLFLLTLSLSSLFFGALALVLTTYFKRCAHWPLVWASCLLSPLFCALAACTLFAFPQFHPAHAISTEAVELGFARLHSLRFTQLDFFETDANAAFLSLSWLYLIGVFVAVLRMLSGRFRAHYIASRSTIINGPMGIDYGVTEHNVAPFILSSFIHNRHRIVISHYLYSKLSTLEIEHILRHELAHHQHNDDQVGLLLRTALAATWFIPISYWAFARWENSIELRSDLTLLGQRSNSFRSAYANTFVKALHITAARVRQYPAASFSTNHLRNEKMRIRSILHGDIKTFKGFSNKLAIVSGAALVAFGIASFASTNDKVKKLATSKLIGKNAQLMMTGKLTASFGLSPDPFNKGKNRDHKGVDLAAPVGTPIYAPAQGTVVVATDLYKDNAKYGKVVVIKTAGNIKTLFAQLDSYNVSQGDTIQAGTLFATVGQSGSGTGPHLHIETTVGGTRVNPLDVWKLTK